MERLIVEGGRQLNGTVRVSGSKNAALPIIFATILTEKSCRIENLPVIRDVEISLSLLSEMGAEVRFSDRHTAEICTKNMRPRLPRKDFVSSLRASTYLIGAMLGRFGVAYLQNFGGCNFSNRPIDMHLYAARALGAEVNEDRILAKNGLSGAFIAFDKISVGATVNALFMAVSAKGITVIENAASEPHVENLIAFLRSMGARIFRLGSALVVEGSSLGEGRCAVIGDMIEGGTYLLAGLCTGGEVSVVGCEGGHLRSFLSLLSASGVNARCTEKEISVSGAPDRPLVFATAPYPAFPTDLQPQTAFTSALFFGADVTESVFPERFGYLDALENMGIVFRKSSGRAYILPSSVHPASVRATDLRGGAALLLAALSARGRSEIMGAPFILRGYEDIEDKFSRLGANIKLE